MSGEGVGQLGGDFLEEREGGREDDDWVHAPPKRHHFRQGPRPPRLHHKPSSIPLSFRQTQKHRGQNIGGGVHVGAKKVYAEEEEN